MSDDENVEGKDEEFEAHKLQPTGNELEKLQPTGNDPERVEGEAGDDDFEGTQASAHRSCSRRSRGSRAAVVGRPSRGGPARFGNGASAPFPFLGAACRQDAHDRLEERCTGVVVRIVEE